MMLHELVYTSISYGPAPQRMLEEILASSRRNNLRLDITGVLLYENGSYVQLLEGPREAVRLLYYGTIALDVRHRSTHVCWEYPIATRGFGNWQMGFARGADLASLAGHDEGYLGSQMPALDLSSPASTGRKLLHAIYASMAGRD
jgi:hypothetical protein